MKISAYSRLGRRCTTLAAVAAFSLFAVLVLAACGGSAAQSDSSDASQTEATDAEASQDTAEASHDATEQQPSEAYVCTKIAAAYGEGSSLTVDISYDEHGKMLTEFWDYALPNMTFTIDLTNVDWDECGYPLRAEGADTYVNGELEPLVINTTLEENENGVATVVKDVYTHEKESYGEGELIPHTHTYIQTMKYGDDVEIRRASTTKREFLNEANELIKSDETTVEFDEDGLQTAYAYEYKDADGTETKQSASITWAKDANGNPTSFELVFSKDDEDDVLCTGDVELDESGLVSRVFNLVVDGEEQGTVVTVERKKVVDPVPYAYGGWKSFALTDVLFVN